jgi:hypothetical protein
MDFTGRDTFMAASSWAWVLGPAGAMATVGVVIASATVAEEVIEAAAAPWLVVAVMRAAAVARRAAVVRLAATQGVTIQAGRVPVQVMRQLRVAAEIPAAAVGMPAVAVVDMPAAVVVDMPAVAVVDMLAAAVVVDMPAADTSNL